MTPLARQPVAVSGLTAAIIGLVGVCYFFVAHAAPMPLIFERPTDPVFAPLQVSQVGLLLFGLLGLIGTALLWSQMISEPLPSKSRLVQSIAIAVALTALVALWSSGILGQAWIAAVQALAK